MRKTIFLIFLCYLLKTNFLNAQQALTKNFVVKDLNGVTWDFYSLLNQGVTIVFDASATWCGPCWNYHKSGELKDFYNKYGPNGTVSSNKAMVFLIEVDCGTPASNLNSWITGTPYPIINLDNPICSQFNQEFDIGGFPVVFMICPDKKWYSLGQPNSNSVFNSMNSKCPCKSDVATLNFVGINATSSCSNTSIPVSATINNSGTDLISKYDLKVFKNGSLLQTINRTTNLQPYSSESVSIGNFDLKNTSELKVTVENPNGVADGNPSNNSLTAPIYGNLLPVFGYSVISQSSSTQYETADKIFDDDTLSFWHNNWPVNAPLPHSLSFDLKNTYELNGLDFLNRQNNSNGYPYTIEFDSSIDNITWITPYTFNLINTKQWQKIAFPNRKARYIRFKVVSTISGTNVCSIAEVKLRGCINSTAVDESNDHSNIQVFPNPTCDYITITGTGKGIDTVTLTDISGRSINVQGKYGYFNVSNLAKGIYTITIVESESKVNKKLIIER